MTENSWTFRGREMATYGDVSAVMSELYGERDEAGAREFMAAYRAHSEHADANVGYLTGYFGDMAERQQFFDVSHPVFGRSTPTAEEAFDAGFPTAAGVKPDAG